MPPAERTGSRSSHAEPAWWTQGEERRALTAPAESDRQITRCARACAFMSFLNECVYTLSSPAQTLRGAGARCCPHSHHTTTKQHQRCSRRASALASSSARLSVPMPACAASRLERFWRGSSGSGSSSLPLPLPLPPSSSSLPPASNRMPPPPPPEARSARARSLFLRARFFSRRSSRSRRLSSVSRSARSAAVAAYRAATAAR